MLARAMGLGTAINVVAVLVGGGMQAIWIVTLLVGVANFLELAMTGTRIPSLTLEAVK